MDLLGDYDPFSAPPDVRQYQELTGVDQQTARRHLDAARQRGQGLEEAVDAFFSGSAPLIILNLIPRCQLRFRFNLIYSHPPLLPLTFL